MTPLPVDAAWLPWVLWCSCIVALVMAVGQSVKGLIRRSPSAWARWRWAFCPPSLMLGMLGIFFGAPVLLATGLQPSVLLAGVLSASMGAMSPLLYDGGVMVLRRFVRERVAALDATETAEAPPVGDP